MYALSCVLGQLYEVLPGWQSDNSSIRSYSELSQAARRYVERIEELVGVPVFDPGEMLSYTSKSHCIWSSVGRNKNRALSSLEHFSLAIHLHCRGSCDTQSY